MFGGGVPSVDAAAARALVDDGAVMIDVRTTAEWNAGHAPMAQHVPLSDLSRRIARLPKNKTVVVVCRSGSRSRSAGRQLAAAGVEVVNLKRGMYAWQGAGQPLVDRRGRPGTLV
ncbi:MAG: rhodanese-like domain-containing protein [Actinomycetes bacterium]